MNYEKIDQSLRSITDDELGKKSINNLVTDRVDEFLDKFHNNELINASLTAAGKEALESYAFLLILQVIEDIDDTGLNDWIPVFLSDIRKKLLGDDYEHPDHILDLKSTAPW